MEITINETGGVSVLNFQGKLDTTTTPDAESQVNAIIDGGATKLLVNFSELDYISSTGLRLLLASAKKLKASGGSIRVCGCNPTVKEVFEISGFVTILGVFDSEKEALEGF